MGTCASPRGVAGLALFELGRKYRNATEFFCKDEDEEKTTSFGVLSSTFTPETNSKLDGAITKIDEEKYTTPKSHDENNYKNEYDRNAGDEDQGIDIFGKQKSFNKGSKKSPSRMVVFMFLFSFFLDLMNNGFHVVKPF